MALDYRENPSTDEDPKSFLDWFHEDLTPGLRWATYVVVLGMIGLSGWGVWIWAQGGDAS